MTGIGSRLHSSAIGMGAVGTHVVATTTSLTGISWSFRWLGTG